MLMPGLRHVAIFMPNFGAGGAERVNLELCDALLHQGIRVTFVVTAPEGELATQVPSGAAVHNIGKGRARALFWPMRRALRILRPDVWVVAMWPYTISGILAAKLAAFRVRCVVQDHCAYSQLPEFSGGVSRLFGRVLGALAYRFADERVAVSKGVATDAADLFLLSTESWRVIYNSVPERHRRATIPERASRSGTIRLLAVGRLTKQKGFDTLITAVGMLADLDFHLSILGEGPERARLSALIKSHAVDDRVNLVGYVGDTGRYYAEADVFVLSSRYEGFAIVLAEALSYGLRIVSTDCKSGPSEILDGGRYGLLIPVGDPVALADAIRRILKESPDGEFLRQRAQEFSAERFISQHCLALFPNG